jgi:looped-hinge helix DNA binding domain, AbrB family
MPTAKITSKGQLTVPKSIRLLLGIEQGDQVRFYKNKNGKVVIEALSGDIKNLKGIVPKQNKPVSLEDMDKAIRKSQSRKK